MLYTAVLGVMTALWCGSAVMLTMFIYELISTAHRKSSDLSPAEFVSMCGLAVFCITALASVFYSVANAWVR